MLLTAIVLGAVWTTGALVGFMCNWADYRYWHVAYDSHIAGVQWDITRGERIAYAIHTLFAAFMGMWVIEAVNAAYHGIAGWLSEK